MTIKVKSLHGRGVDLAVRLSDGQGMTYGDLLSELGTPAGVYDYLHALLELSLEVADNPPWLNQGFAGEGEYFEGQPVACDGWFVLENNVLYYTGNRYTHGIGPVVTRLVKYHDRIEWSCTRQLGFYTGRY